MHKNALVFEKAGKSPQRWELRPQTPEFLLPSLVTVIFSKAFVTLTPLLSKRNKEFRNSNNVLLLPLISYFKLCAGYLRKRHGSDFSAS